MTLQSAHTNTFWLETYILREKRGKKEECVCIIHMWSFAETTLFKSLNRVHYVEMK